MRKETRFNLIFLGLFLGISLPGAAILFRAKLDPNARLMYMPPSVRKTLAYMVPHEAAGDVVRTQPAEVLNFVENLLEEDSGRRPLRLEAAGGREQPIISSGRHYELLDIQHVAPTVTIDVLLWSARKLPETPAPGSVEADGPWNAQITGVSTTALPEEIREVLREEGYTSPPGQVTRLRIECAWRGPADEQAPEQVPAQLIFDPNGSSDFLPSDRLQLPLPSTSAGPLEPAQVIRTSPAGHECDRVERLDRSSPLVL